MCSRKRITRSRRKGAASHGVWCHRPAHEGKPDSDHRRGRGWCWSDGIATTRERLTQVFGGGPGCGCCSRVGRRASGWRRSSRRGARGDRGRSRITRRCMASGSGGSRPIGGMWRRWPRPVDWAFIGRRIACRRRNGTFGDGLRVREQLVRVRTAGDQSAAGAAAQEGVRVPAGARGVRGRAAERAGSPARVGRGAGAAAGSAGGRGAASGGGRRPRGGARRGRPGGGPADDGAGHRADRRR